MKQALAALLVALCLAGAVRAATATTDAATVAVIYPVVREPYRAAFLAIVDGIQAELGARARIAEVDPAESADAIATRIADQKAGRVLLLGKYGLDVAQTLNTPADRVVGAVLARPAELPKGIRGMSMVPSPARLFGKLHELAPEIGRAHV